MYMHKSTHYNFFIEKWVITHFERVVAAAEGAAVAALEQGGRTGRQAGNHHDSTSGGRGTGG